MITHDDLNGLERGMKGVSALLSIYAIGTVLLGTNVSKIGTQEALTYTAKTMVVDSSAQLTALGVQKVGEICDLPVAITIILSFISGIVVSTKVDGIEIQWKNVSKKIDHSSGNVDKIKDAGIITESGSGTRFKYEHNPMDNPKAARDIIENPDAVYGFSPNPESTRIGKYADKIDWTNPEQVAVARQTREAYHNVNESMLQDLYNSGYTTKDIAAKMVEERNMNRINSYINNGDLEGLEIVKQSNLETYGNEFGMSLEQALEKYGSYEEIINATVRSNPGMDACTGLYDIYHGGK